MGERTGYFRLGLFVVVSLAVLFAILFVLGGRSLFQPTFIFETYFDRSVSGLEVGSPVEFRGVPLGEVVEINTTGSVYEQLLPFEKRKGYIVVRAKLSGRDAAQVKQWQDEMPAYIKRGMRVQTQLAGVTGQQYLALDLFDPQTYPPLELTWKPAYPYLPSAPSLTGQIINNGQAFLASLNEADIKDLSKNVNRLVQTLDRKVEQIPVADLSNELMAVLKDARDTIERVDQVVAEAQIDQAVNNIASASGRLDALLADPGLRQTVDNAAAFTARLRTIAVSGRIDRIVKDLDQTIQRVDALVGNNQYDVRVIVQDLRATADNLRGLSEKAKRYPAGLLIGGPPEKADMPWKESK